MYMFVVYKKLSTCYATKLSSSCRGAGPCPDSPRRFVDPKLNFLLKTENQRTKIESAQVCFELSTLYN